MTISARPFLLVYVIALIRDLDDPFEYKLDGSAGGAAEVSLRPLERLNDRLTAKAQALEDDREPADLAPTSSA